MIKNNCPLLKLGVSMYAYHCCQHEQIQRSFDGCYECLKYIERSNEKNKKL